MGLYEHWPYANFHELNLDWILEQIRICRDEYQNVQQLVIDLEDLKNKYIEVYATVAQLESDFNKFTNNINNSMEQFETSMTESFNLQAQQIQNDFQALTNQVNAILSGYNDRLIAMDIKLDNALDNLADSLTMINPFTGEEESMSAVIYQLASFHMEDAITAGEYDSLALTASYYDGLGLTAYQYDVEAKTYLMP